jgi:hypothetical protein
MAFPGIVAGFALFFEDAPLVGGGGFPRGFVISLIGIDLGNGGGGTGAGVGAGAGAGGLRARGSMCSHRKRRMPWE